MKRILCALSLLALVTGCATPEIVHPEGAAVMIKDSHFHTRYCGHYLFGEQWYFIEQHRHGVNCGHELVDGYWTLVQH
jgi:hypothetical protein